MSSTPQDVSIDIRRLRYFMAICEHGGFSKAASAIGIAQPALTRQIKLLEEEVGLPLVTRTGRGAGPTAQGELLLKRMSPHIAGLEDAVLEVRRRFSLLEGHVALGMCPTIAPFFRAELESWAGAAAPRASLSIIEAYSGDLQQLMETGRIDLALTYKPARPNGIAATELFSERLMLVSAAAQRAMQRAVRLKDIARLRLVLPSRIHELRRIIDGAFEGQGLKLTADLELDSLDAVKSLLRKRAPQYHTILPARSVRRESEAGLLRAQPIASSEMVRTIAVTRAGANPASPIVGAVHEKIMDLAGSICPPGGFIA